MVDKPASSATADAAPPVPVGTHFVEQRYLYAFAPQFEVQKYIRTQGVTDEVSRLTEIIGTWRAIQLAVQLVQANEATVADSITITEIPAHANPQLAAISADDLFRSSFATHQTDFRLVEIDKLIAAQRTVNLEYVERLARNLGTNPSISRLIDFCLSPRKTLEPIQHLELADGIHAFSSPNTDLRYLGAFRKDVSPDDLKYAVAGGLPAAAVIGFVGYGASSINAFQFGSRLFLNNGFHRICAMRSLGITMAPIAIMLVKNLQLEFPPAIAGMPREYLLSAARPALVKDFFNPEFTTTIKTKARLKVVVVNLSQGIVGQHDIPS